MKCLGHGCEVSCSAGYLFCRVCWRLVPAVLRKSLRDTPDSRRLRNAAYAATAIAREVPWRQLDPCHLGPYVDMVGVPPVKRQPGDGWVVLLAAGGDMFRPSRASVQATDDWLASAMAVVYGSRTGFDTFVGARVQREQASRPEGKALYAYRIPDPWNVLGATAGSLANGWRVELAANIARCAQAQLVAMCADGDTQTHDLLKQAAAAGARVTYIPA